MWNNSVLFPAVVLAPVTLSGGPLASLTVLTTLGYAGSAATMYRLLRRRGASVLAGGLGGAVFGFSPGMVNAGAGQADTGQPAELVAGWFLGPNASGNADDAYWGPPFAAGTVRCLDALWQGTAASGDCASTLRPALSYWHPAAVVADTSPAAPLGRFLIKVLGEPAIEDGQLLAWRSAAAS